MPYSLQPTAFDPSNSKARRRGAENTGEAEEAHKVFSDGGVPQGAKMGLGCLALLLALAVAAGEPQAVLYLDRDRAMVGQTVNLNVEVSGAGRVLGCTLPPVQNVRMQAAGSTYLTRMTGGKVEQSVVMAYAVTPLAAGEYTLGPASVQADRGTVATGTVTLKVGKAPDSGAGTGGISIDMRVSPKVPVYLRQPLMVTWRLLLPDRRIAQYRIEIPWLYELKGFRAIDPDDLAGRVQRGLAGGLVKLLISNRETLVLESVSEVGGQRVRVLELRRVLIPIETGEFVLEPSLAAVGVVVGRRRTSDPFDSFFDSFFERDVATSELRVVTEPASIRVLPLPEEGRPADFGGAVGEFELVADVAPKQCTQGDTVTLTATISGRGDLELIPAPTIPAGKGYRPLAPEMEMNGYTEMRASKTFRFPIYISGAGEITLPPVRFPYFEPDAKQYRTLAAGPFVVHAAAGAATQVAEFGHREPATQPRQVQETGRDICDIVTDIERLADQAPLLARPLVAALLTAYALAAVAVGLLAGRRRLRAADPALLRRQRAWEQLGRALPDEKASLPAALRALRRYIADISGGATGPEAGPQEAESAVLGETGNHALAAETSRLLAELEDAVYSPETAGSLAAASVRELAARIEHARKRR